MKRSGIFVLLLTLLACGYSGSSTYDEDVKDAGVDVSATEITGSILTKRSVDCEDYEGSYASIAMDAGRSRGFSGAMIISAATDTCRLISNDIPNHDFNDGERLFPNNVAAVTKTLTIKRSPELAETPTELSQAVVNGVFLNGVIIDILSAGCWDSGFSQNVPAGCRAGQVAWLIDPMGGERRFLW